MKQTIANKNLIFLQIFLPRITHEKTRFCTYKYLFNSDLNKRWTLHQCTVEKSYLFKKEI